ncbi:DUF3472 domain-containing protein [Pedobacter sp. L105]|uniref:DUF3472 domain-containing protein n=1 Tax=Pedobacter sp. L105 TaxID=1641871 RepID=UPI00131A85BD|nr:DUF3472 domain-containing protein [Pedobacter sp. L105]
MISKSIPLKNQFNLFIALVIILNTIVFTGKAQTLDHISTAAIPLGGNTWRYDHGKTDLSFIANQSAPIGGNISNDGIVNWSLKSITFKTFVRFAQTGPIRASLTLKVPTGKSEIEVIAAGKSLKLKVEGDTAKVYDLGKWNVRDTGYYSFKIKGLSKTGKSFAEISNLTIKDMDGNKLSYVQNNEGNYFHWGRRGPSVHLSYKVPANLKAEWFYNEVTVPVHQDIIGSYFMADGFGEGYFGMQVNSPTERRVLFSVWSPFKTDDPGKIPDNQQIRLISKGKDVHAGSFGDEGSGGQSYLNYLWQAGVTYRFLLHGEPLADNYTRYTAYFYDPKLSKWLLIASFSRPATQTYLTHLHSFLENFEPEAGNVQRSVDFTSQWVRSKEGEWIELNTAMLTGDATAHKKFRMDYGGGLRNGSFYLHNGGFFNDYTPLNTIYKRSKTGKKPDIDLSALPE